MPVGSMCSAAFGMQMAVSFSWYSMKLDEDADDKLNSQTPDQFGEKHYPPYPQFGRLHGGEVELLKSEPITKQHKTAKELPGGVPP